MREEVKQNSGFLVNFKFAAEGILYSFRTQRNMRIHFAAAVLVLFLAVFLHLSKSEFIYLLFSIFLVLIAEMINSAIELAVDLYGLEYLPLAKAAKDVSAGAVLLAAVNSVIVGILVFYPYLLKISIR
ncbi:MAG: putative membrane protein [Desulfotomaculum sp. 46_296]|nr:MAG: putative membrane protein [Desulfotomaculum sp. 46_296]HAU32180.1 diacylglycerol kinase [Desulfotomaculum sp.]